MAGAGVFAAGGGGGANGLNAAPWATGAWLLMSPSARDIVAVPSADLGKGYGWLLSGRQGGVGGESDALCKVARDGVQNSGGGARTRASLEGCRNTGGFQGTSGVRAGFGAGLSKAPE